MASAVVNSTGDIFYSKVTDTNVTLTNNILDGTSAVDDSTPADGKWTSADTAGATTADKITSAAYTTIASEAGPGKSNTCVMFRIGAASALASAAGNIAYGRFASANMSSYDAISFYIKLAQVAPTAGSTNSNLQLLLCSDNAGATVVETLSLPAIPVTAHNVHATDANWVGDVVTQPSGITDTTPLDIDKWVRVVLKVNSPSSLTALQSVALKYNATLSVKTNVYLYQVRLMKSFPGRTNFSISETIDSIDVSDYQSLTNKEFASTYSTWTVTMDGHKEGAPPMDKGKEYVLGIWESDTVGQCFVGNAFYTSFTPSGSFNESVKYSYSFQGTSTLQRPLV